MTKTSIRMYFIKLTLSVLLIGIGSSVTLAVMTYLYQEAEIDRISVELLECENESAAQIQVIEQIKAQENLEQSKR